MPQAWKSYMGMEMFRKYEKTLKAMKISITMEKFNKNGTFP